MGFQARRSTSSRCSVEHRSQGQSTSTAGSILPRSCTDERSDEGQSGVFDRVRSEADAHHRPLEQNNQDRKQDSLAEDLDEEALPLPSYSDTKDLKDSEDQEVTETGNPGSSQPAVVIFRIAI